MARVLLRDMVLSILLLFEFSYSYDASAMQLEHRVGRWHQAHHAIPFNNVDTVPSLCDLRYLVICFRLRDASRMAPRAGSYLLRIKGGVFDDAEEFAVHRKDLSSVSSGSDASEWVNSEFDESAGGTWYENPGKAKRTEPVHNRGGNEEEPPFLVEETQQYGATRNDAVLPAKYKDNDNGRKHALAEPQEVPEAKVRKLQEKNKKPPVKDHVPTPQEMAPGLAPSKRTRRVCVLCLHVIGAGNFHQYILREHVLVHICLCGYMRTRLVSVSMHVHTYAEHTQTHVCMYVSMICMYV